MAFSEIWKNLPAAVSKEFEAGARLIEKKRGDTVYRAGDRAQGLYFVQKGLVGLMLLGEGSGREHLLRFFKQGQFFGHRALFSDDGYHGSTVVLEPTQLKLIPKATVLQMLTKHPELYREVAYILAKELRQCEVQHVMILENQILPRTAQALVYLKELHPDHLWTRQEIANFCASTVSTVIKAMAELEALGLIRQDGRSIEILNRDGLIHLQDHDSI